MSRDSLDLKVIDNLEEEGLRNLNENFEMLEDLTARFSIYGNTKSQLFPKVSIKAGGSIKLSHGLSVVPSFRIIVRQSSGEVILDGEWTNKTVEFKNNSLSIFIGDILVFGG